MENVVGYVARSVVEIDLEENRQFFPPDTNIYVNPLWVGAKFMV